MNNRTQRFLPSVTTRATGSNGNPDVTTRAMGLNVFNSAMYAPIPYNVEISICFFPTYSRFFQEEHFVFSLTTRDQASHCFVSSFLGMFNFTPW